MSTDKKFPQPPANIKVKTEIVPAGTTMWRVYNSAYSETGFNPGKGDSRFSPLKDVNNQIIPSLYAGESIDVALMESVFHDVPHTGDKEFSTSKFNNQMISELTLKQDLVMAKLHGPALRGLGITEAELIHCDASEYQHTRAWGEKVHASAPNAQGMKWASKQAGGMTYVFFGDRVNANAFNISTPGTQLNKHAKAVERIEHLIEEMDVRLFDPDTPDT